MKGSLVSRVLLVLMCCFSAGCQCKRAHDAPTPANDAAERPNILLIVTDDMGYSDLGAFGGEIHTPRLDALAQQGVRLTNFYAGNMCSPTRVMLLSGMDHHLAGMGSMAEMIAPNQMGKPGYEGYLNDRAVSVASLLRDAGYQTYMAGKWHIGYTEEQSPYARGFKRSFALLQGGASHMDDWGNLPANPKALYREDQTMTSIPDRFYSTEFYTDKIIEYLEADKLESKPFFAYLAYTAPHWPLQAPEETVQKYKGRYEDGPAQLRERRMGRLKELGMLSAQIAPHPFVPAVPDWSTMSPEQRKTESRKMEIYAAMVDLVDVHVGRLLDYLESTGKLDNTVVFFFSDNGAEGGDVTKFSSAVAEFVADNFDNSYENMGKVGSYIQYGPHWAQAATAPSRLYKGYTTEGGIKVPAFIYHKGCERQRLISDALATVQDIAPTMLELAGVQHPGKTYRGREVLPMTGRSMIPFLQGRTVRVHPADVVMGWELFGRRAVRQGNLKAVFVEPPFGPGRWQLFNLVLDPAEMNDLAQQMPDSLAALQMHWERYVRNNNVVLPDWMAKPSP